jgi:pyruvate dehydrogenase E1 component alpha subunit
MSDPAKYRKEGELDSFKQKDCLKLAVERLAKAGVADGDLDKLKEEVDAEAQDAYDFAEASPLPDPAKLYDYTYASYRSGEKN